MKWAALVKRLGPPALLILVAALVMVPGLIADPLVHDSWWIDIVWLDQFAELLRGGIVYPRWLPHSFDGLGAPVFYFYPPLAFYLGSLFKFAGLSTYSAILLCFFVIMAGGALACWQWLRGWTHRPLLGALFLLVAPYHLCEFYRRGALAEALAAALIPALALALRHAATQRRFGWLAIGYAALILSHLPLALIASILFIAPYALWLIWQDRSRIWSIASGLALGLGLAAIFLLPALSLQWAISVHDLWAAKGLRPESWTIWRMEPGPLWDGMLVMLVISITIAVSTFILGFRERDFWTVWTIACSLLAIGIVPYFWALPLLDQVQFPWRSLALAEFGFATILARSRAPLVLTTALILPLLFVSVIYLQPPRSNSGETPASLLARYPDVTEYLPAGAPRDAAREIDRTRPRISTVLPVSGRDGITTLGTFYFPSWRMICAGDRTVMPFPSPQARLLSYRGGGCEPQIAWTKAEVIGGLVSALSLLVLALLGVRSRRHATVPMR